MPVLYKGKFKIFQGYFSDINIPCKIEGMDSPLILSVTCDVKGLSVTYSVSLDAENTMYVFHLLKIIKSTRVDVLTDCQEVNHNF